MLIVILPTALRDAGKTFFFQLPRRPHGQLDKSLLWILVQSVFPQVRELLTNLGLCIKEELPTASLSILCYNDMLLVILKAVVEESRGEGWGEAITTSIWPPRKVRIAGGRCCLKKEQVQTRWKRASASRDRCAKAQRELLDFQPASV